MKHRGLVLFPVLVVAIAAACTVEWSRDAGNPALASDEPCFVRGVERELRCVSIEVPLDWNQPEGHKIKVVAAIVFSISPQPQPDPLIILAGGPGQGATSYGSLINSAFRDVLKSRDIVLFDQRGTGRSGALQCKLQEKPWSAVDEAAVSAATHRCAAEMTTQVEFYSLREVVEDIEALRRASGYGLVNLWGGSYGTVTAQQYIRKYGMHVRAAILDGALSPARALLSTTALDGDRAMRTLLDECRSATACAAQFGDLEAQLNELLEDLETGREVELRDPLTGELTRAWITRDLVAQILRGALYTTQSRTVIPQAIAAARQGRFEILAALASDTAAWATDTMAAGATLFVVCADQVSHQRSASEAAVPSGFAGDSYRRTFQAACSAWPHRPIADTDRTPLQSAIPVLIFSGGLDPVTPPSSGDEVAAQFAAAAHAIMPDGGHNVSPSGCAPRLMGQFLENGSAAQLDFSCLHILGDRLSSCPLPVRHREAIMIHARGVKKRFGAVTALNGVDFVAPDGAITSILGANGAGKTTIMRAITGLIHPDEGAIAVDGIDPRSQRIASLRRLGALPDDHGLYERLTAREHLEHVAAIHGLKGKDRQAVVDAAISSLDMESIADRRVRGFSFGERMKVALGGAIVHRPANLLLDEPMRGLDVIAVRMLRRVLLELKARGVCILMASHVMAEVARLADRVVVISGGKVIVSASPAELLAQTGLLDIEDAFVALATEERS